MDKVSILITLLSLNGIGYNRARLLFPSEKIHSESELTDFLFEKVSQSKQISLDSNSIRKGIERAKQIISNSQKSGIEFLVEDSPGFPGTLQGLKNYPPILSYKGDISLLQKTCIAVIGTRDPTNTGKSNAYRCGVYLGQNNYITVSGLARGIDSAAHMGALDGHGQTIAVFGNGLDSVYPAENRLLAKKILDSGSLILSHCFYGDKANSANLMTRNKIIAGISEKIIVAETKSTGGTLFTVKQGILYRKGIGCLTSLPETRPGNLKLLQEDHVTPIYDIDLQGFLSHQ